MSALGSKRTLVHYPTASFPLIIMPRFPACFSEVFFGLQGDSSHAEIHICRQGLR